MAAAEERPRPTVPSVIIIERPFEGHHKRSNQRPSTSFSGQGRIEHLAPDTNTKLVTPVTSWSQCRPAGHRCPKMVIADPNDAKNSQHTTIASLKRPIERY